MKSARTLSSGASSRSSRMGIESESPPCTVASISIGSWVSSRRSCPWKTGYRSRPSSSSASATWSLTRTGKSAAERTQTTTWKVGAGFRASGPTNGSASSCCCTTRNGCSVGW